MTNRHKDDFYPTPETSIRPFLDVEIFDGDIWEPACGNGAISSVLREHGYNTVDTDLNDWGFGISGRDFLLEQKALAPNIVTNPPYKYAQEFIQKAIDLKVKKHCWLLRLAFLEGIKRFNQLYAKHPPCRVYVFSKRQTMIRADHDAAWYGSGKMAFAWFVWTDEIPDITEVDWL